MICKGAHFRHRIKLPPLVRGFMKNFDAIPMPFIQLTAHCSVHCGVKIPESPHLIERCLLAHSTL